MRVVQMTAVFVDPEMLWKKDFLYAQILRSSAVFCGVRPLLARERMPFRFGPDAVAPRSSS